MGKSLWRTAVACGVALTLAFACGGDPDSEFEDGAGKNGGGNGASGGLGGGDGSITDPNANDADLNADSACAQANGQASLQPLDMFIMFDSSISMGPGDCNVGQSVASPWCYAINALSAYLKGTGASGNAAALQFFGQG